jgi:Flp pilus assembly protein TadG
MKLRRRSDTARGQALVEVLLVLPVLLLLVMGAVDVGRLLFASVAIEEATQEGAIFAAYSPTEFDPIRTRILSSSDVDEVQDATVTVMCNTSPAPGQVEVTAEVNYPLVTPVIAAMLGNTVRLSATVVATNLAGAC